MEIDLVITRNQDGTFRVDSGIEDALFTGSGSSEDEAVGSWFRQNREAVNVKFTTIKNQQALHSTMYGKPRTVEQLGPFEKRILTELNLKTLPNEK